MFLNEVHLSGKAQKDSERKGSGPYRFTIVQGGGRKKDSDERWPKEHFECQAWSDIDGADSVKAGEVVSVVGRLKHTEWTNTQGEKRRSYQILCSEVKPHREEHESKPQSGPIGPHCVDAPNNLEITDADIPF